MIKQFMLLFVGTFFISQFVLMMQFLWRYVDELIGKGLSLDVMAQFFWYMGLMLLPQALPLAILLSSLIVFGNLGESSELTAIMDYPPSPSAMDWSKSLPGAMW